MVLWGRGEGPPVCLHPPSSSAESWGAFASWDRTPNFRTVPGMTERLLSPLTSPGPGPGPDPPAPTSSPGPPSDFLTHLPGEGIQVGAGAELVAESRGRPAGRSENGDLSRAQGRERPRTGGGLPGSGLAPTLGFWVTGLGEFPDAQKAAYLVTNRRRLPTQDARLSGCLPATFCPWPRPGCPLP